MKTIWEKKNPGMRVGVIAYLVLLIVDLVLTLKLSGINELLEANPIVYNLGFWFGISVVVALNIALLAGMWYLYKKSKSDTMRYILLSIIVTVSLIRLLVIFNNASVLASPPTMEQALQVTTEMKQQAVAGFVWQGLIPFLAGVVTYYLFRLDHKIEAKE